MAKGFRVDEVVSHEVDTVESSRSGVTELDVEDRCTGLSRVRLSH